MTLPRRLTLAGEDEVRVAPAGDIDSLRYEHRRIEATELPANEEVVLEGIEGSALELMLEIDAKDAPMVELNVLRSPDRQEHTRIAFYKDRGFRIQPESTQSGAMLHGAKPAVQAHIQPRPIEIRESLLTLDTSYSSTLPGALSRAPETAPIRLDPDEPLQLRVFIDHSVVRGVRERQAVRCGTGLSGSTGQHGRVPARPGQPRRVAVSGRLADEEHLRVGRLITMRLPESRSFEYGFRLNSGVRVVFALRTDPNPLLSRHSRKSLSSGTP